MFQKMIVLFFGLVYVNMKHFALSFDMLSRSSVFNGNTGYKTMFSCVFFVFLALENSPNPKDYFQINSSINE